MLTDRALRIEVLINSPGPHDQVRVREPFLALKARGVDVRLHERPFRFNSCIRPHSLVIWQRPLPENRQRQWEHLQWLRQRGCLLLTEWDDHPDLFPKPVRTQLLEMNWAPLVLCHALHTSSTTLASALESKQPLALVLENTLAAIPALNLDKHKQTNLQVFIGNQNRGTEHSALLRNLYEWLEADPDLTLVIVGDQALASSLPKERVMFSGLLPYWQYRQLLGQCQIALLPLQRSLQNACKTPIKLLECAAESVATVSGPELYERQSFHGVSIHANRLSDIVPLARSLAQKGAERAELVKKAYLWANQVGTLQQSLDYRYWLYSQIWKHRRALDQHVKYRLGLDGSFSS